MCPDPPATTRNHRETSPKPPETNKQTRRETAATGVYNTGAVSASRLPVSLSQPTHHSDSHNLMGSSTTLRSVHMLVLVVVALPSTIGMPSLCQLAHPLMLPLADTSSALSARIVQQYQWSAMWVLSLPTL